ncbi:hypothetical protein HZA97_02075 [Candidatus Woesearchaeota archaeon]|nr:hypothetical protein [Candidatus Woesearchaeota archaeon]
MSYTPLKKAFHKNKWKWEECEDLFKCISFRNKKHMWLYNYNDTVLVQRNHPVLVKCRGLVVDDEGNILNFPFERFFNEFEEEQAEIDWCSAEIHEKVDGSLICVFWSGTEWEVTTRGSFYPTEIKKGVDFSALFKKHFSSFDKLEKKYCYMFEIVSKENRIVTWYDYEAIYLLGARDLHTLKEISQKELDKIAKKLSVKRPLKYSADSIEQCKKLFENFKKDQEGLVVSDANFNRVKVKQESYLQLSNIIMLKEQDLFEYVLGLKQIDVEYLKKLPEVTAEIERIRQEWVKIQAEIKKVFEKIKNKPTRKEFALEALKYPFKSILFAMLDNQDLNKLKLKWENLKKIKKEGLIYL